MAIFHLSVKIISRGKGGKSAVAAAAYRAGERITNERDGVTHDYTRKGGVVHAEILLPANAPPGYADRAVLWNAVERAENRGDSQLAREIEISLPVELTREQNIALAREYARRQFVDKGMCADLCVHDKKDGNPHAHVMLTMRPINDDATWGDKQKKVYVLDDDGEKIYDRAKKQYKCGKVQTTDWNEQTKAEEWRAAWADAVNAALARQGEETRIDHRSHERRGVEELPSIKMGAAAFQMERRGVRAERGDMNRRIEVTNGRIRSLRARINKVSEWLRSVPIDGVAPTMVEMMNGAYGGERLKSQWQRISDLKTRAKILMFLQENNIGDMADLAAAVRRAHERQYDIGNKLKKVNRRLDTLELHLTHCGNLKEHKAAYTEYLRLDPKKREAYREKHGEAIEKYRAAKEYLDAVMNGKSPIPVKEWRKELSDKTAEKHALYDEFYKLRDDVRNVEILRRNAERIMGGQTRERTAPSSKHDHSL
jgi:hypothetical protein